MLLPNILMLVAFSVLGEQPMRVEYTYHDTLTPQEQALLKEQLPEYLPSTQQMMAYGHIARHLETAGSGFELCRPARWVFHAESVDIQVGYMEANCAISG